MPTATLSAPNGFDTGESLPAVNVGATREFDEARFLTIPNVPVFSEHSTVTRSGRQLTFGFNELKVVCDRCNRRIAETGDYSAIVIGHTPSEEAKAKGAPDPEVVGFAGPYRMGKLVNENQFIGYAILCDFHVYRECAGKLKQYPRRSPELWIEEDYAEMFLDPIALLGAEAPRLDLGLLYSAYRHGVEIEKYAAVAPGPFNCHVPGDAEKTHYQGNSVMDNPQELVAVVLQAFEQSDMGQFIKAKMAEESAGGGGDMAIAGATDAGAPGMTPPPTIPPAVPPVADAAPPSPVAPATPPAPPTPDAGPAAPPTAPDAPAIGGDASPAGEDDPDKELYSALDELKDEELEKYMSHRKSRMAPQRYAADGTLGLDDSTPAANIGDDHVASDGDAGLEQYSRVNGFARQREQVELETMRQENAQLKKKLAHETTERINYQRLGQLQALAADGYAIDPVTEVLGTGQKGDGRLSYSRMSQAQFEDQLTFIIKTVPRAPLGETLPYSKDANRFTGPGAGGEMEKYHKEHSDRAFKICKAKAQAGQPYDYGQVLDAVANGTWNGDAA